MGGSHHPQAHRHRARGADGQHLVLGQHPQQPRLQRQGHVADLVEEQGAAVGLLDQAAFAARAGAGEAARQVAEQFALDQRLGDGRAIDRHEGLAPALAGLVQGPRQVFLAGAGFAGQQHVDRRIDQAPCPLDQTVQHRVATRQGRQRRGHAGIDHAGGPGGRWRGRGPQEAHVAAAGQGHRAAVAGHPLGVARQRRQGQVEQALEGATQHRAAHLGLEGQLGRPVVADDAPALVQRQQPLRVHVQELRCPAQAQHPVAAEALQKAGVLDVAGVDLDQLQGQVLALFAGRRAQGRNVEHGGEPTLVVVNRRSGAGQGNVGGVEVVGAVHRQRLAGGDAGAHATGAGQRLAPVRAQVKAGLAQAGLAHQVAQEVDGHAARIGQQHTVAQPGHLGVERLQAMAGDLQKGIQLVLVFAQAVARQDHRFLHAGRVQPVVADAAPPGIVDHRVGGVDVPRSQATPHRPHHGVDVHLLGTGHGEPFAPAASPCRPGQRAQAL